jgi:hypothetical protein
MRISLQVVGNAIDEQGIVLTTHGTLDRCDRIDCRYTSSKDPSAMVA